MFVPGESPKDARTRGHFRRLRIRVKYTETSRGVIRSLPLKFLRLKVRERGVFCGKSGVRKCAGGGKVEGGGLSDKGGSRTLRDGKIPRKGGAAMRVFKIVMGRKRGDGD